MPGKLAAVGLILVSLLACALPRPVLRSQPPPPTKTPSSSPLTLEPTSCIWNWATQVLPELSVELQTALEAAGLSRVTARAEAYGEDCIDPETEQVRYFAALQTDFHITLAVDSLADRAGLGQTAEQVLVVLDGFPPEAARGPNPGYIGIRFLTGQEELNLWFSVTDGRSVRALGLQGAELLEALQNR